MKNINQNDENKSDKPKRKLSRKERLEREKERIIPLKDSLKPEQARVLKEFEELIKKSIPCFKSTGRYGRWARGFGAGVKNNTIIDLGLSKSELTNLPDSIHRLKNLKILNLSDNKIRSLPETIGNLEKLEILNISNNKLTSLPNSIGKLKNLVELDLRSTKEKKEFGLKISHKLVAGKLKSDIAPDYHPRSNVLRTLPESIGNLKALKKLSVYYNLLASLPESIGNLKLLEQLGLHDNKITALPNSVGQLKNLKIFHLRRNELKSLPESIGQLENLKEFSLSYNKLRALPESIRLLKSIERLTLHGNPWNEEFKEVAKKSINDLKDYLRGKAGIHIFISHAVSDFEDYQIEAIARFLESQDEIYKVFYCEQDLTGNIDDFMNQKIPQCQILLFVASEQSIFHSKDCMKELEIARKNSLKIIPIKSKNISWDDLTTIVMNRELGHEYYSDEFDEFCDKLYNYILHYKRKFNLFEKESY